VLYDGPGGSSVPQTPPLPKATLGVNLDGPSHNPFLSDPRSSPPVPKIIIQSYHESHISARLPRGPSLHSQHKGLDNSAGSLLPPTGSITRPEPSGGVCGPAPSANIDRPFSFSRPVANQYPNDTGETANFDEVYPAHHMSPRHSGDVPLQGRSSICSNQAVGLADEDLDLRASCPQSHSHDTGIHRQSYNPTSGVLDAPQLLTEADPSLHTANRVEISKLAPQPFPQAPQLETKNRTTQQMRAPLAGLSNQVMGISSSFSDYAITGRSSLQGRSPRYIPSPDPGVRNYFAVEDRSEWT